MNTIDTVLLTQDERNKEKQIVIEKIETLSTDELIDYFTSISIGGKQVQKTLDNCRDTIWKYENWIQQFVQDNWHNPSDIDQDDLERFADKFNIELSKRITVTLTVTYTGEFTVPLGFDNDSITESDFAESVTLSNTFDNLEIDSEETSISDFEVEDDD